MHAAASADGCCDVHNHGIHTPQQLPHVEPTCSLCQDAKCIVHDAPCFCWKLYIGGQACVPCIVYKLCGKIKRVMERGCMATCWYLIIAHPPPLHCFILAGTSIPPPPHTHLLYNTATQQFPCISNELGLHQVLPCVVMGTPALLHPTRQLGISKLIQRVHIRCIPLASAVTCAGAAVAVCLEVCHQPAHPKHSEKRQWQVGNCIGARFCIVIRQ